MLKTIQSKLIVSVLVLILLLQASSSLIQILQIQGKLSDHLEADAKNLTTPFIIKLETKMMDLIRMNSEDAYAQSTRYSDDILKVGNISMENEVLDLFATFALAYGVRDIPALLTRQEGLQRIMVVDRNGKILYDPVRELVGQAIASDLQPYITGETIHSLEADASVHVFVPFFLERLFLGDVVVSYSTQAVDEEKQQALVSSLGLLSFFLLIGGLGAWGISLTITRPIHRLSAVFEIIATGKFDQQVDTNRDDELGKLAESFDFLRNSILEKVRFIENYNRTLEQKVLERTETLVQQKDRELEAMFQNIQQGILIIGTDKMIEDNYAAYLETLLETTEISGTSIMTTLFQRCDLEKEAVKYIDVGLSAILGYEMNAYGANQHLLVEELTLIQADNTVLRLEIDWHPIQNQAGVIEKMMITLRDVTQIRQLQGEVKMHIAESEQLRERLDSNKTKIEGFGQSDEMFSPEILTIRMLLPNILYISTWNRGKASEIFLEDTDETIKTRLPLQKIEDAFFSKLIRPHFSFLVNPEKDWGIERRSSSDYDFVYMNHHVPISRNNYLKMKESLGLG